MGFAEAAIRHASEAGDFELRKLVKVTGDGCQPAEWRRNRLCGTTSVSKKLVPTPSKTIVAARSAIDVALFTAAVQRTSVAEVSRASRGES